MNKPSHPLDRALLGRVKALTRRIEAAGFHGAAKDINDRHASLRSRLAHLQRFAIDNQVRP